MSWCSRTSQSSERPTDTLAPSECSQIDDIQNLSDIAASWSLNDDASGTKSIAAGEASNTGPSSPANEHDREWHTQRWLEVPKTLFPTKAQLEIERESASQVA